MFGFAKRNRPEPDRRVIGSLKRRLSDSHDIGHQIKRQKIASADELQGDEVFFDRIVHEGMRTMHANAQIHKQGVQQELVDFVHAAINRHRHSKSDVPTGTIESHVVDMASHSAERIFHDLQINSSAVAIGLVRNDLDAGPEAMRSLFDSLLSTIVGYTYLKTCHGTVDISSMPNPMSIPVDAMFAIALHLLQMYMGIESLLKYVEYAHSRCVSSMEVNDPYTFDQSSSQDELGIASAFRNAFKPTVRMGGGIYDAVWRAIVDTTKDWAYNTTLTDLADTAKTVVVVGAAIAVVVYCGGPEAIYTSWAPAVCAAGSVAWWVAQAAASTTAAAATFAGTQAYGACKHAAGTKKGGIILDGVLEKGERIVNDTMKRCTNENTAGVAAAAMQLSKGVWLFHPKYSYTDAGSPHPYKIIGSDPVVSFADEKSAQKTISDSVSDLLEGGNGRRSLRPLFEHSLAVPKFTGGLFTIQESDWSHWDDTSGLWQRFASALEFLEQYHLKVYGNPEGDINGLVRDHITNLFEWSGDDGGIHPAEAKMKRAWDQIKLARSGQTQQSGRSIPMLEYW
jgi:hypothetical protein